MFRIKSFNINIVKSQAVQHIYDNFCNKSDYQLQCSFKNYSHKQNSNEKQFFSKTMYEKKRQRKYKENKLCCKFLKQQIQEKQNKLGSIIYLKNVEETQQKRIKCLQYLTRNKKCPNALLQIIKHQIISLHVNQTNQNQKKSLSVSMEDLFRYYIEYYQDKLRKALLDGSVKGKIILPFLIMCKKIKKDQKNILLLSQFNEKNRKKCINKLQIYKVFNLYQPKLSLLKQMSQNTQKNKNLYEQVYRKYESSPFFEKLPHIRVIDEQPQEQSNQIYQYKKGNAIFMMEEQLQEKIQNLTHNPSSRSTQNKIQALKVQGDRQSFQKQIEGEKAKCCLKKQSKIKQRFQDRFKRQLKQLSDDASQIVKSKILE